MAKYDNTKLEGVELRDERTLREVRVLHREGAALGLDLKMTPKAVLHSLVRLGPVRCDHARRHTFKEERKDLQTKSN